MAVQTWVARFVVDHGQVTEEGGHLRTFPRRRLDEPDTDLHVLAEPSGPNAADLGAQPLVRRLALDPGDLVLAASLSLESRIDADMLDALLTRGTEEALPEIYLLTRDLPTFALFAISCVDDGTEEPDESLDAAAPDM